jgi:hypothetical protein
MAGLPVLGILFAGHPVRFIFGSLSGIRIFALFMIGAWIGYLPRPLQAIARKYLIAAVVIEFGMAAIQYASVYGPGPIPLLKPIYDWDRTTQLAWGSRYVINGRSIGTFVNPNTLGFAGVLGFWVSALVLRGWMRRICVPLALATVFFSQSRGSMFALAAGLLLWTAHLAVTTRLRAARDVIFFGFVAMIPAFAWTAALGDRNGGSDSPILARFERGLLVLSEGSGADHNANARVHAWERALNFYRTHALGTWIEPQSLFGGYIDSDYVRLLLQGSVVSVFAFVLALYGGMRLIWLPATAGRLAAVFAAGLAVNSISAIPLVYPVTGAYWLACGFYLADEAGTRGGRRLISV